MLRETKVSMQHLIRERTRAENSIQHALEAAYQPLPDTTLMCCAGWIAPPLHAFVSELSCNVDNVPFWILSQSFLVSFSDQIMAGVRLRNTNHSTPTTQELVSIDATISIRTARVVRQVKRKPHLFSVVRRTVT